MKVVVKDIITLQYLIYKKLLKILPHNYRLKLTARL